jgi:hypothetical protein
MRVNGYFGVRTVEAIIDGLKHMDTKAEVALFIGLGIAAYGYFKYGKDGKKDGKCKETQN